MTNYALYRYNKQVGPTFPTEEEARKDAYFPVTGEFSIREVPDPSAPELSFGNRLNYLEVYQEQENERNLWPLTWPLTVTIAGDEESCCQTYNLNENEIVALFNLLYKILKRDYKKKLEELQQAAAYANLEEL